MSEQKMLTVKQAAKRLNVSETMLLSAIEQRIIIADSFGEISPIEVDRVRSIGSFYLDALTDSIMKAPG